MRALLVWMTAILWAAVASAAPDLHDGADLVADVYRLADERLALMPAVAAAKWATGQPVTDPVREEAVIRSAADRAVALGLERDGVVALLRVQIRMARDSQERLLAHWRRDGYDGPDPAPDLTRDLRPLIDALTTRLLRALYLAAPFTGDAMMRAGVTLPAERWSATDLESLREAVAAVRHAGGSTFVRAEAAGLLRIGTPADYAPFASATGSRLQGADVELALGLAEALKLEAVFVRTTWAGLSADLAADRFDVAVGGVSATAARMQAADASVPLSSSGKTAIGRCADRDRYATLDAIDVPRTRVIENRGGTNEQFARAHLAHAHLIVHPDNRTVFGELVANRADIMFTDETEVGLVTRRYPGLCRLLSQAFEPVAKVFLFARDGGWTASANPWLADAVAHGTPARLLEAYSAP